MFKWLRHRFDFLLRGSDGDVFFRLLFWALGLALLAILVFFSVDDGAPVPPREAQARRWAEVHGYEPRSITCSHRAYISNCDVSGPGMGTVRIVCGSDSCSLDRSH